MLDEHRDRYIHECLVCKEQIFAYRNCTGEFHSKFCDGRIKKIDYIAPVSYNFNASTKKKPIFTGGVTKYSTDLGMEVNSKDIDRICKEKGLVYMSDREISQETKRNKQYNTDKFYQQRSGELKDKLNRVLNR